MCPYGEKTAKVTTRYLSPQYTDQAMGWATDESGLDSQWRQRSLFAGVSGLALAPTEPPSRWVPWAFVLDIIQPGVKLTTT